ncbi:MAG TPA: DNA replication and repair protein RecF [Vicinamibacteria bacterium]|nr:DNA replication and repair protein RecF [Vicinamibacteria bacterium]
MWLGKLEVRDLRRIREVTLNMEPGLNVFVGRNAQGKTSLLEAVGLLARGRSFRTEDTRTLIRHGAAGLVARGRAHADGRSIDLEIELSQKTRRLKVDGREVAPRSYHGRLEAVVYSTDRLRVVRGPMRERRAFLDRSAAALWPSYRQALRDFERVLQQRNAALLAGTPDQAAWDERFLTLGGDLRQRRAAYVERLRQALRREPFAPAEERFDVGLGDRGEAAEGVAHRERLRREMDSVRREERRARRSLVGPHRDPVLLTVNDREAGEVASSGQARSLLLALALAALAVYREERGTSAVALLDDLDSELDEERSAALCREVARRGQALVTTAHPDWARRLGPPARLFEVEEGRVRAA